MLFLSGRAFSGVDTTEIPAKVLFSLILVIVYHLPRFTCAFTFLDGFPVLSVWVAFSCLRSPSLRH